MISNEDIRNITEKCATKGFSIKVYDISFLLLCKHFEDESVSYRAIFGSNTSEDEMNSYICSPKMQYLKELVNDATSTIKTIGGKDMSITFEENKEGLIKLLGKISEAVENEEIDKKDAIKLETEIRTKLNDKFSVGETTQHQFVIVEAKFNHICEWTHKECYLQTKEYAKKNWNLYEKKEVIDEIKKSYDLIKKQK